MSSQTNKKSIEDHFDKSYELVEKPPKDEGFSNLAIMGHYMLTPDIFNRIDEIKPRFGSEIQITDRCKNQHT